MTRAEFASAIAKLCAEDGQDFRIHFADLENPRRASVECQLCSKHRVFTFGFTEECLEITQWSVVHWVYIRARAELAGA